MNLFEEANSEFWSQYLDNMYKDTNSSYFLAPMQIEFADKKVADALNGSIDYKFLNTNVVKNARIVNYIIDKLVEDYQKTGNKKAYDAILTYLFNSPQLIYNIKSKAKVKLAADEDYEDKIKDTLVKKLPSMLANYIPSGKSFLNYIQSANSVLVGAFNIDRKGNKVLGTSQSIDTGDHSRYSGGSGEDDEENFIVKSLSDPDSKSDVEMTKDTVDDFVHRNMESYESYLKKAGMPHYSYAFHKLYVENIFNGGKPDWKGFFDNLDNLEADKSALGSAIKKYILSAIIIPALKNDFAEGYIDSAFAKGLHSRIEGVRDEQKFEELVAKAKEMGDKNLENALNYVGLNERPDGVNTLTDLLGGGSMASEFLKNIQNSFRPQLIEQFKIYAQKGGFIKDKADWGSFVPQKKAHTTKTKTIAEPVNESVFSFLGEEWGDALKVENALLKEVRQANYNIRNQVSAMKSV